VNAQPSANLKEKASVHRQLRILKWSHGKTTTNEITGFQFIVSFFFLYSFCAIAKPHRKSNMPKSLLI
jgi:hypothetical protein